MEVFVEKFALPLGANHMYIYTYNVICIVMALVMDCWSEVKRKTMCYHRSLWIPKCQRGAVVLQCECSDPSKNQYGASLPSVDLAHAEQKLHWHAFYAPTGASDASKREPPVDLLPSVCCQGWRIGLWNGADARLPPRHGSKTEPVQFEPAIPDWGLHRLVI